MLASGRQSLNSYRKRYTEMTSEHKDWKAQSNGKKEEMGIKQYVMKWSSGMIGVG